MTTISNNAIDGEASAYAAGSELLHARSATARPVDRLGALWAGKWRILLATAVAGLLTLATTALVPKTYSSDVQVGLIASPVLGSSVADLARAGNNLAAQYAQIVTSESVLQSAAASAGTTSTQLRAHTSSGTLASQNIVLITIQSNSPETAEAQANAVALSLTQYVADQGAQASVSYNEAVAHQLAPLDAQIDGARRRVETASKALARATDDTSPQTVSAASARLQSAQSLLTALTDRRASLVSQASLQAISLSPTANVLGGASPAVQVEPRPFLYALAGALVGLVIATQVTVLAAERRPRYSRR